MSTRSRLGLLAENLKTVGPGDALPGKPTCNPCREDDHGRCPTAITEHGSGSFSSTFDCACYAADEQKHALAIEERDADFQHTQQSRERRCLPRGHRGPLDEYERWAGDY